MIEGFVWFTLVNTFVAARYVIFKTILMSVNILILIKLLFFHTVVRTILLHCVNFL